MVPVMVGMSASSRTADVGASILPANPEDFSEASFDGMSQVLLSACCMWSRLLNHCFIDQDFGLRFGGHSPERLSSLALRKPDWHS